MLYKSFQYTPDPNREIPKLPPIHAFMPYLVPKYQPIQGIINIVDPKKIQHLDKTVDKEE